MIIDKIRKKGFFGTINAVLNRFEAIIKVFIKDPISRLAKYHELESKNFSINFLYEGARTVKIPKIPFLNVLLGSGISFKRNIRYESRPYSEVLLRKTIYELYQSGYIDNTRSIIDIGSWISDNSIVWAKFLSKKGCVFAIDPSPDNIAYGRTLADLNHVNNIKFLQAVCAEKPGIKLDFDGSIDMARFKVTTSNEYIKSTTIDIIIDSHKAVIGLLHVDVEGFELAVLKGAENVIKRDAPVISFEQHISKEKISEVVNYLKSFNYKVFMVNEVLPGNHLDCRNFIAFPVEKGAPTLSNFEQSEGRDLGVYSAAIGEILIEI